MTLKLTGKKFGRLTVQNKNPIRSLYKYIRWDCLCSYGNKVTVCSNSLVNGNTESCGCLRTESMVAVGKANATHEMSKTKTYAAWAVMIQRCTNKNNPDYKSYGAKGITVCSQWLNSFDTFYQDMGPKPPGKSMLKRIQTDGDYNKDNCKWIVNEVAVDKVRA
jgi:hypothetical protein